MHSPLFRRTARLFAVLLLVWTAADVCDYGMCVHGQERIGSFGQAAFRPPSDDGTQVPEGYDDCFCCSRVVDVRIPFRMDLQVTVARVAPDDVPLAADLEASRLYHPPLA